MTRRALLSIAAAPVLLRADEPPLAVQWSLITGQNPVGIPTVSGAQSSYGILVSCNSASPKVCAWLIAVEWFDSGLVKHTRRESLIRSDYDHYTEKAFWTGEPPSQVRVSVEELTVTGVAVQV